MLQSMYVRNKLISCHFQISTFDNSHHLRKLCYIIATKFCVITFTNKLYSPANRIRLDLFVVFVHKDYVC